MFSVQTSPARFNLSRAQGRSDFTKFEANAARLQSTKWGFNLYTALRGQYTDDVLLSAEEFGFGGSEMGRAYDSSEIAGDRGVAGTVEVRVPLTKQLLGIQSEPYAFYDLGKVWNLDTGGESFSAAAAGAGLRLNFRQNMSGNLTFAVPLTKEPSAPEITKGMNPSITFGITIGF
jgi:hemolysin activation/secretion protein